MNESSSDDFSGINAQRVAASKNRSPQCGGARLENPCRSCEDRIVSPLPRGLRRWSPVPAWSRGDTPRANDQKRLPRL